MAHTEHFVISKKSKRLLSKIGNSFDYWRGKRKGTICGEIEVFASSNHHDQAKKILDLLKVNNMEDDYFKVKIEVK